MDIEELQEKVIELRGARDWAQYHNPKDLVVGVTSRIVNYEVI